MKALTDLQDKLQTLNDNMIDFVIQILRLHETDITNMNTAEQLYEKGETRDGVKIADFAPYAPLTVQIKQAKGQPTNRVTLLDEGDFHKSVYIIFREDGFEIVADDWKTEDLLRQYGKEIFGLSDENLDELTWQYLFAGLLNSVNQLIINHN
jgi:hypothetical protein